MANLELYGWTEMINRLTKLSNKGNLDQAAMTAVNGVKDAVAGAMRSSLAASEGHRGAPGERHRADRSTGSAAGSVEATAAKVNSYGVFSVAKPNGHDSQGVRNAKKAALLEYGGNNLPARPWRSAAVGATEGMAVRQVEEILKSVLDLD